MKFGAITMLLKYSKTVSIHCQLKNETELKLTAPTTASGVELIILVSHTDKGSSSHPVGSITWCVWTLGLANAIPRRFLNYASDDDDDDDDGDVVVVVVTRQQWPLVDNSSRPIAMRLMNFDYSAGHLTTADVANA